MRKLSFSFLVASLVALSVLTVRIIETPVNVLTWDVFGYYLYLPANFIYNDPQLTNHNWLDEILTRYQPSPTLYQTVDLPNGNRIIKYSSGLALIYSPFFFLAHWIAGMTNYPADGFSLPYQLIIGFGGIIWAIVGIFLFRLVLKKFFNETITAIVLILILLGTNYFHLVSIDGTLLTHNFLFTLYAALVLLTIEWHTNPRLIKALGIGAVFGLISLVRPSEAVCILIPLFWSTGSPVDRQNKIKLIRSHFSHFILAALVALLFAFVQFYYWKHTVGEWIYYSYSNNPGEGFRFVPPFINEFLFSFRKGWLIYTPLMIFALIGFFVMAKKYRKNLPALLLFFLLDIWIISAWTAWWYGGGSFSARSIVPAYAILAIPLGFFLVEIFKLKWQKVLLPFMFLLVLLNLFQSWQFNKGIIDKERMTKAYYCAIFGKVSIEKEKLDHLLLVDRSTETIEEPEYPERYSSHIIFKIADMASDTSEAIRMGKNINYSKGLDIPFKEITNQDHAWIRSSMEIYIPKEFTGELPRLVNSFHYKGEAYKYRSMTYEGADTLREKWLPVTYWYLTPEVRTADDNLKVYVWNKSNSTSYIRNLKVEVFELVMY